MKKNILERRKKMKKAMLRKLRAMSNEVLGEEKTNQIIEETVKKVLEDTKPKKKKGRKK